MMSQQALDYFKEDNTFFTDTNLKIGEILNFFESKIQKCNELFEERESFDEESGPYYLQGISKMLDKSTTRFISDLEQFSEKFKFEVPKTKKEATASADILTPKMVNKHLFSELNNDLRTIQNTKKNQNFENNLKLQNRQEISLKSCSRGQPTCLKIISPELIALGFTTGEVVIFSLQNYKP